MYELSLVASCVFLWLLDYRVIQMVQWVEGVWIVLWQCLVVSCSWNATYASTAYKLGFNQLEIWSIILLSLCTPTFLIFHTFEILVCSPILGFGVLSVKFIFFLQIMILDFFFWDFATHLLLLTLHTLVSICAFSLSFFLYADLNFIDGVYVLEEVPLPFHTVKTLFLDFI